MWFHAQILFKIRFKNVIKSEPVFPIFSEKNVICALASGGLRPQTSLWGFAPGSHWDFHRPDPLYWAPKLAIPTYAPSSVRAFK